MARRKAPFEGEMLDTVESLQAELYGKWRTLTGVGSMCKHCKCTQPHPLIELHFDFCPCIQYNRVHEDRYPDESVMNANNIQVHIYYLGGS